MKIAILGDSFVKTLPDTYLDIVCKEMGFEVMEHKSWPGSSEYYTYETFQSLMQSSNVPDVVLFAHTEPARLPTVGYHAVNLMSVEDTKINRLPREITEAAKQYYYHLYNERYHDVTYRLMIDDMQRICDSAGIRHIHLLSFPQHVNPISGLWIMNGIDALAHLDGGENYHWDETLLNHLSSSMNEKLGNWLIPHIRYYIDKNLYSHVVNLYTEEFQ